MQFRPTALALAVVGLVSQAQAQQAAPAAEPQKIERVEVTGSMIKRTDRETPSVVQVITAEDIKNSGYSNIEDLLKANSSVDLGSVGDGAASGFVSGVAAISLRGLGAQGTLTLINGRRLAPVGAVDINFGRGNLVSVNTIPKGAIERIEILKDGASAIYGSDAMAGVVNYVLKKEYQGVEIGGSIGANDQGAGKNQNVNVSFGFGNLDTQKFNIFGGLDVFHRDRVGYDELKNVGDLALYDKWNADQGVLPSFFPSSRNSFYGNYYAVPTALTTANSSVDGTSFLGTLSACPDDLTVGKGIATKSPVSTAVYPVGQCRFNTDAYAEAISKQDRVAGSLRANFLLNSDTTAYADLMVSRTKTVQRASPYALTASLVSSADPRAATWPLPTGSILSQSAIILPIGHPDNPTNGTSAPRAVQVLYRFDDVPQDVISDLKAARFTAGVIGVFAGWDYDAALVYSRQDNEAIRTGRILASGLNKAISAGGSAYHFGKKNDAAGIASISADASNEGKGEVTSLDVRGSRELFNMAGGKAAMAVGLEARRESLSSSPDENYLKGDFIGLVGNSAKGTRDMYGGFAELRLPVQKNLEVQAALRGEHYSDFGNSTTGKLGFKWSALPSTLAFRGTAATGYRAPSISQIGDSFVMSFHSNSAERAIDPLRCDPVTLKSKSTIPAQYRDCNLLGYTAGIPTTERTGSLATIVAANPKLKPETSQSATLGFLFSPTNSIDLSIDTWYFKRSKEIRVQGGIDVVNAYKADPAGNEQYVLRDTNQATWLRDGAGNLIANSGPILALKRQYGNYNYTITSGVDYELNIRLPANQFGKFKFKIEGTYTGRYDQKVLDTSSVSYWAGTTSSLIPKTKASARVDWSKADWNAWARFNHTDGLWSNTTSAACQTAPATSTTLAIPRQNGWCTSGGENTLDLGIGYKGFKNLRLNASMLNVTNQYTATNAGQVPAMWTFYDLNTTPMLGRRWSISATYSFE